MQQVISNEHIHLETHQLVSKALVLTHLIGIIFLCMNPFLYLKLSFILRFFQNSVKINNKSLKQGLIHSLNETQCSEYRHLELENTSVRARSTRQSTKKQQRDLYETEATKLSESLESCKENSGVY